MDNVIIKSSASNHYHISAREGTLHTWPIWCAGKLNNALRMGGKTEDLNWRMNTSL
jgi:hypothetical protein